MKPSKQVLNLGPNHKNDMFGKSKILSSVIQMRNLKLFFPILIANTSQDIEIDFDNIEVDFESSGYGEIVTETTTITTITSKTIINAGIETIISIHDKEDEIEDGRSHFLHLEKSYHFLHLGFFDFETFRF